MTWTTIPPWLYQNDLPDEQLQEVYVREARKKVRELEDRLRALTEERQEVEEALWAAWAFLSQAEEALARYQPARARLTQRKRLPKP